MGGFRILFRGQIILLISMILCFFHSCGDENCYYDYTFRIKNKEGNIDTVEHSSWCHLHRLQGDTLIVHNWNFSKKEVVATGVRDYYFPMFNKTCYGFKRVLRVVFGTICVVAFIICIGGGAVTRSTDHDDLFAWSFLVGFISLVILLLLKIYN